MLDVMGQCRKAVIKAQDEVQPFGPTFNMLRIVTTAIAELTTVTDERYPQIGVQAKKTLSLQMVQVSQGLPGYMHLIGRDTALSGLKARRRSLSEKDFKEAISESVRRSQDTIVS